MYDVAVVGAGLIGSACAKYLRGKKLSVALVGPTEEQGALGSCYDEGRIYRIADPDKVWADLAEASIQRYKAIEDAAGEAFFEEVGCLIVGDPSLDWIHRIRRTLAAFGTEGKDFFALDGKAAIEAEFSFLRLPAAQWLGLWQPKRAGHLSPRRLAQLQAELCTRSGADVFHTQLEGVQRTPGGWSLRLADSQIEARKVLLAAGAMTSWLWERPLDVKHQTSQAILYEVSAESRHKLEKMPVMIINGPADPQERWYILPPIQYPDGRCYLKMGYDGDALNKVLQTQEEVTSWLRAKEINPELLLVAGEAKSSLFPSVKFTGRESRIVCITDQTKPNEQGQRRPYVDFLHAGLGVATGGNGWAAKSSDHIGWLASEMMSSDSGWATDAETLRRFPKALFQAQYKTNSAL